MRRNIFFLLCLMLMQAITLQAQSIEIEVQQVSEVTVQVDTVAFEVSMRNISTNQVTNPAVAITLPNGIAYIPGSFTMKSGHAVLSSSQTNDQQFTFTAGSLSANDELIFEIKYQAESEAIANQLSGTIFRNEIDVAFNGQDESFQTDAYNILYASLSITNVSPKQKTIISGDELTRSVTIVNGGNGKIGGFLLTDTHPAELTWLSSDLGKFNALNATLIMDDFSSIGNGDQYLDPFESITITQTLSGLTCADKTLSSVIGVQWGDAGVNQSQTTNAHVTVDFQTPNIQVTTIPSLVACFTPDVASKQEVKLYNKGSGNAQNIILDLMNASGSNYDASILARIDPSSITYRFEDETTETSIQPTSNTAIDAAGQACLGAQSIGQVLLSLPEIPAKKTMIVSWNTYRCCITTCGADKIMGWRYELDYQDVCGTNTYDQSGKGQGTNVNYMTFFTEAPVDIYDNEPATYTFTVSSHGNNLPQEQGAHYELVFDLPIGLDWSGNITDIQYTSGPTTWTPSEASFNASTRELTVKYPVPAPFHIPKSELNLTLIPNCTSGSSGELFINLKASYIADVTCANACPIPMSCQTVTSSYLHCPVDCSNGGMVFTGFSMARQNFGAPDNNQNGLPDGSGSLDFNKVKANRVMVGDTLQSVFGGLIKTSAQNPNWGYAYAETVIPDGNQLTPLSTDLRIFDASSNSYLTFNGIPTSYQTAGTTRTFSYDFSPNSLGTQFPALQGFQFEEGDSLWLMPNYKVTGNIGGAIREITVENEFYVSKIANPTNDADKYQCGIRRGRFTLIGYFFAVSGSKKTTITGCSKVISQNFHVSIGDCCSNYEGGNLFPYEYRRWAFMEEAKVTIPANYTLKRSYIEQRRTKYTNASTKQTINPIQPSVVNGQTMTYDLASYYKENGGSWEFSDDGFGGTIYLEIVPNCFVPQGVFLDMPWEFTFHKNEILGGGTETITSAPDQIKFSPRLLSITSNTPRIDGLEKTVTWHARMYTNGSSVDNAWVHIKSPTGEFEIERVYDKNTGIDFPKVGDLYQIGTVSNQEIEIQASYSNCNYDYIEVYTGYECSGFPADFASFQCSYRSMKLYAEPKPVQTQFRINGRTVGDQCSPIIELEVEVNSVQLAVATELFVDVNVPSTSQISYVPGSAMLLYPLNNSYVAVSDPVLGGNSYEFDLQQLHIRIMERGLPGVLDLDSSRLKLKFQMKLESGFATGDFITTHLRSKAPCGKDLPTIRLAYDPSIQFEEKQIVGLNTDLNNSWSVNWVDYDNDGFEDLFIPEYESNKPNALYRNNGDRTFTKITEGELVNSLGGTVSSTWGDYDNDGDLDVFLANNLQAVNHLYENNGDGTFTKIVAGDIANYGGYCHGAAWGDYDNDGFLDLFVADFMPTRFNLLYHNNGDGTFDKVTTGIVVTEANNSVGGSWADIDNDGDLDLFVVNTNGQNNALYINEGNGVFSKETSGHIVNDSANSVGSSWGDYDNDGDLDVFVANASKQNNFLYTNNGDGTFQLVTSGAVVNDGGHSHGSVWSDLDNDGDLDLIVTNDQDGENFFYANNGDGSFTKLDNPMTRDLANSFGVALGDYDNDGDLDLFIANHSNQANQFYENSRGQCSTWACVRLEGTRSNKGAVGTKVRVKATIKGYSIWQMREVATQTGGGAGGQGSMRALFGLGDATGIDSLQIEWPSGVIQTLTQQPVNGCIDVIEESGTKVCGTVYHDKNQNCQQDAGEENLANQKILILPINKVLTTDKNGNYTTYLKAGTYTVETMPEGDWSQTCPAGAGGIDLTINASDLEQCGLNFGMVSGCQDPDLTVEIATTALRRGFRNTFAITYSNIGANTASNVSLAVDFNEHIVPVESDVAWASISNNVVTWNLGDVPAGTTQTIYLTDSISRVAPLGEFADVSANITADEGDCNVIDNSTIVSEELVGSVDPNDKLVFYIGSELGGRLGSGDVLVYKIRFQNVGNYYASRVIILDTLSDHLDPSTVTLQGESHELTAFYNEDGILRWEFIGIYLPDSVNDEPNSHGFVQFTIKVKDNLPHGTQIDNSAAIQFDYNDYIITNTVTETVFNSGDIDHASLSLTFSPNPMRERTLVRIATSYDRPYPAPIQAMMLYDATGRPIRYVDNIDSESYELNRDGLPAGMYVVKIRDIFGGSYIGKLIIE